MATEVKLAPMIDNKADAGSDWFFCDGCLSYHPPEYQSRNKRYCNFAFSIVQDKEFPVEDDAGWLEKPITDLLPASILQAWEIEDAALKRLYSRKPTPRKSLKAKSHKKSSAVVKSRRGGRAVIKNPLNFTGKNRALRKDLPEDEIRKSTEPSRILAERYGVSHTLIANIRKGQRILV